MSHETIVAVFDTPGHAAAAVADLERAGAPADAIVTHTKAGGTTTEGQSVAPARTVGFWASLFSSASQDASELSVYDRSLEDGATIVTVTAPTENAAGVMAVLDRHNPVDLQENEADDGTTMPAARSGMTTPAARSGMTTPAATSGMNTPAARSGMITPAATAQSRQAPAAEPSGAAGDRLSLGEEVLAVGKRMVNRGTTRVRRYVVETPVAEQVTLRDENVSVERHAVANDRAVADADFSDKVIEMTATSEQAVVSKTVRVREEVVLHRQQSERTETVHDTVRSEQVEITRDDAGAEQARAGS